MKIEGRPVSGSHTVDTPPTSHRSQMVNSGSMPMPACSAACSVPGHKPGWMPASTSTSSVIVYQKARVTSVVGGRSRSEEHTSELQSRQYLVCRLLLEKKKSSEVSTRRRPWAGYLSVLAVAVLVASSCA